MTAATPEDGQIVVRADGPILLMKIDRPRKRNGFTPKMFAELSLAIARLEADDNLLCGVIHAEGEHFTAGLDLPKFAPMMERGESPIPPGGKDPCDLEPPFRTKPIVAAVRGICYTLGIEMMLACDIVVAASDCRFAQIEVRRGIMPTGGATIRMIERAGWGNAMRYLLTAEEFDAATALRFGFVQDVVDADDVLPRALAIAGQIAKQAPLAVRATRANARLAVERGPDAAVADFTPAQTVLARTADAREGVQSFIERREPRFTGR